MGKVILNFKQIIRFLVSIIISREFSFVYCVLGTIAQVAHCYFLLESVSSLDGNWKIFQAVLLSIFISSSLLYFVAIADNTDKSDEGIKEYKKVLFAINLFTIIEILINVYYYSRHLLIDSKEIKVFDFIFAILISCLIPITIKLYSSFIRAKSWILEFEGDKINNESSNNAPIDMDKLEEFIKPMIANFEKSLEGISEINTEKVNELIGEKLKSLNEDIDKQIKKSFGQNQELFLTQFENKTKMIVNDYLNKIKNSVASSNTD